MIFGTSIQNRILALLPKDELALIEQFLEPIELPTRFFLAQANKPVEFIYFFNSGLASIIASSPQGQQIEVGLVGWDGFATSGAILGAVISAFDICMQGPGAGFRMRLASVPKVLAASPAIQRLMLRYIHVLSVQIAYTALSNAVHHFDERLARWLLMCHDRSTGDNLVLTHDFLSFVLAVRRPTVTMGLHNLEGNRLIYATRGIVTIRDRMGLEDFASDCYGQPEAEYRRVIGKMR